MTASAAATPSEESQARACAVGLDDAYAVDGPEANRELYAAWAPTYESDFIAESRYIYHQQVAEVFCDGFADVDQPVLDAGCGTGIVGAELRRLGVTVIDGIDISPEMLAEARSKSVDGTAVYRELVQADLTEAIALPDHTYDGIVSAGAFTHGHLGPESLSELLRVARGEAHCAIGINSAHFSEFGFGDWLDRCVAEGAILGLEFVERPIYDGADLADPDNVTRIAIFRVARGAEGIDG